MTITKKALDIGGKTMTFELGKIAKQAAGSVVVQIDDTMVLVTACCADEPRSNADFLPLTVDYRENTYAGGRIPGGFFKREGRPTEKETLTCRVIDRGLRPLFPTGYFVETQVIGWVLSADSDNDPDVLAMNGASIALMAAGSIPFDTPIASVRIGRLDGEFVLFPSYSQREESDLDLVVSGTENAIAMVECGADKLPENVVIDALELAHSEIKRLIAIQREIIAELKVVKAPFEPPTDPWPVGFDDEVRSQWKTELTEAMHVKGKFEQKDAINAIRAKALEALSDDEAAEKTPWVKGVFRKMTKEITRETILGEGKRLDGRAFDEIRPISCEVGFLPRAHGSALFTRGETQSIVTCTLGVSQDRQLIESYKGEWKEPFMLHYNFPPFSVGEARFLRGSSRREIGHGNLARRALLPVLPTEEAFPYTIRIVSDITESNGSSSMASVCGGSLSMMDAGAPLSSAVAGVAMGLVSDGERHAVLSDIAGQEDHYGDMDFKVTGTQEGITALQMDIKVSGLPREILEQALGQARQGRLHILGIMKDAISEGREEISPYAPRIYTMKVDVEQIRNVIGAGGKTIRAIVEQTGAKINVEDDGTIQIATSDGAAAEKAIAIIEGLTKVPEIGEEFDGVVKRLEPYGAFVEILPNQDGLVHISEVAMERIPDIRDVLTEGDEMRVRIIDIDGNDRIKLSRRVILEDEARARGEDIPERDPLGDRRGGRPGGGGRDRDRRGGRDRDRGPRR
ncbi:MAG: polyribonucleotide nucleotidyltransferase [Thermoanaerobaculales bacterium]|nr:polyribonucleotide nucleotidyltransferase [Thermoanaerobaculales bacterium]